MTAARLQTWCLLGTSLMCLCSCPVVLKPQCSLCLTGTQAAAWSGCRLKPFFLSSGMMLYMHGNWWCFFYPWGCKALSLISSGCVTCMFFTLPIVMSFVDPTVVLLSYGVVKISLRDCKTKHIWAGGEARPTCCALLSLMGMQPIWGCSSWEALQFLPPCPRCS